MIRYTFRTYCDVYNTETGERLREQGFGGDVDMPEGVIKCSSAGHLAEQLRDKFTQNLAHMLGALFLRSVQRARQLVDPENAGPLRPYPDDAEQVPEVHVSEPESKCADEGDRKCES